MLMDIFCCHADLNPLVVNKQNARLSAAGDEAADISVHRRAASDNGAAQLLKKLSDKDIFTARIAAKGYGRAVILRRDIRQYALVGSV